jgi:hypothetical protein
MGDEHQIRVDAFGDLCAEFDLDAVLLHFCHSVVDLLMQK